MNTITALTLEQQIVNAIINDRITSRDLGSLAAKTEMAIATADADAQIAESTALDPMQSPDLALARATVEDAKFRATRLKNLLPRIQARYEQVAGKEEYKIWIDKYDPLKSRRDALEQEVKSTYAACVAKLIPLLSQLAPLNAEVSLWCRSKPSGQLHDGDGRWLTSIPAKELEHLVLPDPESNKNLWPPSSIIDWTQAVPIVASPGDRWWQQQQAESARTRIEDAKRADALQEEEGRIRNDPKLWRKG